MPRENVGPAPLLVLGVDREQEGGLGRLLRRRSRVVGFPRLAVALRGGPDLEDFPGAAALAPGARRVAEGLGVDPSGADADLGPGDLVGRPGVVEGGFGVCGVGGGAAGGVCGGRRRRLDVHRAVELGLVREYRFVLDFCFPDRERERISACLALAEKRKETARRVCATEGRSIGDVVTVVLPTFRSLSNDFSKKKTHLLPLQGRCLQNLGHGGITIALSLRLHGRLGEGDAVWA